MGTHWNLFLDDLRFPKNDNIKIARDVESAKQLISEFGCCPTFVSFDHDLGEESESGYDFAKWLCEKDMNEGGTFIPKDFTFWVHSANYVGKRNIEGYLTGYLKHRNS